MKKIFIVGLMAMTMGLITGCGSNVDVSINEEVTGTSTSETIVTSSYADETTATTTPFTSLPEEVVVTETTEEIVVEIVDVTEVSDEVVTETSTETLDSSDRPRRSTVSEELELIFEPVETYAQDFIPVQQLAAPSFDQEIKVLENTTVTSTSIVTTSTSIVTTSTPVITTSLSETFTTYTDAATHQSISSDEYILLCKLVASEYGGMSDIYERSKIVASIMNRVNSKYYPNTITKVINQGCVPYGFNPNKEYYCGNIHYSEMSDAVDYYFDNINDFSDWINDSWYGDGKYNHFYKY